MHSTTMISPGVSSAYSVKQGAFEEMGYRSKYDQDKELIEVETVNASFKGKLCYALIGKKKTG